MSKRVIYKYSINPHKNEIEMPINSEILRIGVQRGNEIVLWTMIDLSQKETVMRKFYCVMTGEKFNYRPGEITGDKYIGTAQVQEDRNEIVVHVFERFI